MPELRLTLTVLKETFAVCQLHTGDALPAWALEADFFSITRTPAELSVVIPQRFIKGSFPCERDWRCMEVAGPLGFTEVGILAALITPLARANVSIFAISSYNTDYILVKEKDLETAVSVLSHQGHYVSRG